MGAKQIKYLNVESLFQDRRFVIPDYQRGYSWGISQIEDLQEDITRLLDKDIDHFTGTIVATARDNKEYEIIDGQQRITTIIILLKTIFECNREKYRFLEDYLIRKSDNGQVLVLKPNKESYKYFRDCIIGNDSSNIEYNSHLNLTNAKNFFTEWIRNADADKILEVVLTKLNIIFFIPNNEEDAGIMFEVINNRGKELSELEKIKNFFIYFATLHNRGYLREKINDTWTEILRYLNKADMISKDDENNFLRNAYIVFFDPDKQRSYEVYEQLKLRIRVDDEEASESNANTIEGFLSFLRDASRYYAYLFNSNFFESEYSNQINDKKDLGKIITYLRCHPLKASIMPLYLSIMKNKSINRVDFLKILEIVNFRVYILPRVTARADSRQASLFNWAHEHFSKEISSEQLKENLIRFTREMCNLSTFVEHLTVDDDEAENYYHWQGIRYFLGRYEEVRQDEKNKQTWNIEKILKTRKEGKSGDYISVEHIWAVNNRKDHYAWDDMQKRRLGNFTLLELRENIKLQDEDIYNKIDTLIKENTASKFQQVYDLIDYKKRIEKHKDIKGRNKTHVFYWRYAILMNDYRETDLVRFALNTWKLEGEDPERFERVDSLGKWKSNSKYIIHPLKE
ncbi:DUF262 domain-containing protein [bacterium]|nr:DUF262 domain-containing protein [bacterium]